MIPLQIDLSSLQKETPCSEQELCPVAVTVVSAFTVATVSVLPPSLQLSVLDDVPGGLKRQIRSLSVRDTDFDRSCNATKFSSSSFSSYYFIVLT